MSCFSVTCPSCQQGGVCVKPGVCTCRPGYIPPLCKRKNLSLISQEISLYGGNIFQRALVLNSYLYKVTQSSAWCNLSALRVHFKIFEITFFSE